MPTPVLSLNSPYSSLFKTEPNYNKLKIFGCLCFPLLRPYNSHKLEPHSASCIFLGYSLIQSAYLCLERITNRLFVSRHVRFDGTTFPYHKLRQAESNKTSPPPSQTQFPIATSIPFQTTQPPATHAQPLGNLTPELTPSPGTAAPQPSPTPPSPSSSHHTSNSVAPNDTSSSGQLSTSPSNIAEAHQPNNNEPTPETQQTNNHPMRTRAKNHISRPNPRYGISAILATASDTEPRTLLQALKHKQWRSSVSSEFDAQVRNRTWDLVPPPKNANIIDNKWIFRLKYLPDGTIDKRKYRLVARGFTQQPGIDYFETFSLVIKSTTIRTVLDIVVTRDWCLRQ